MQKLFITDCEGPVSKNDNAFEITQHLVPDGDKFFSLLSKYDDIQADILKRRGYKAGDTLKLISPFLKACGATNENMREFSARHISLVSGAKDTLQLVQQTMPSFIVSASYEQYMQALCDAVEFSFQNVYCTRLDMDKYKMDNAQIEKLEEFRKEIVALPMLDIPEAPARSIEDFPMKTREGIKRLDEIFWKEIPRMQSGKMIKEVDPVGGIEKARAIQEIIRKTEGELSETMYVGDSITDVQPFQLVKEKGGLTISFNGNGYAIRETDVAILSSNTIVTSILADVFSSQGKDEVIKMVNEWSIAAISKYCKNASLVTAISGLFPNKLPKVETITEENKERLIKESSAFRKMIRGEAIGSLG
jgi:energy-converting hydrogenase A subunit R